MAAAHVPAAMAPPRPPPLAHASGQAGACPSAPRARGRAERHVKAAGGRRLLLLVLPPGRSRASSPRLPPRSHLVPRSRRPAPASPRQGAPGLPQRRGAAVPAPGGSRHRRRRRQTVMRSGGQVNPSPGGAARASPARLPRARTKETTWRRRKGPGKGGERRREERERRRARHARRGEGPRAGCGEGKGGGGRRVAAALTGIWLLIEDCSLIIQPGCGRHRRGQEEQKQEDAEALEAAELPEGVRRRSGAGAYSCGGRRLCGLARRGRGGTRGEPGRRLLH